MPYSPESITGLHINEKFPPVAWRGGSGGSGEAPIYSVRFMHPPEDAVAQRKIQEALRKRGLLDKQFVYLPLGITQVEPLVQRGELQPKHRQGPWYEFCIVDNSGNLRVHPAIEDNKNFTKYLDDSRLAPDTAVALAVFRKADLITQEAVGLGNEHLFKFSGDPRNALAGVLRIEGFALGQA